MICRDPATQQNDTKALAEANLLPGLFALKGVVSLRNQPHASTKRSMTSVAVLAAAARKVG